MHRRQRSDFRERLRVETRASHDSVEAAFDALDTEQASGMAATLRAHSEAISRLLPSVENWPALKHEFERLAKLADTSLDAVSYEGRWAPRWRDDAELHPIAAGYVLLGSRLGAAILKARLRRQSKQWSDEATAYFTDTGSQTIWAALNTKIDEVTDDQERNRIIADAKEAFGLFEQEARRACVAIDGELCHGS